MKTCFRCGVEKLLDEYYKHPSMADGHLNKCKSCTKSDTKLRHELKSKDLEWVEKELARHREKARKARLEKRWKSSPQSRNEWRKRNREKQSAHNAVAKALKKGKLIKKPCVKCGCENSQAHHDDYNKPLDVVWLCPKHHAEHHVQMRSLERFTNSLINP